MTSRVVIVNGLPGVGKTTLARQIATALGWPLMTKDMYKESLFDTLGWSDRAWSRQLSQASMALVMMWVRAEVLAGRDCVVEANFESDRDTPRLLAAIADCDVVWVQVLVVCDGATLWERHQQRGADGSRHPGHQEAAVAVELRERLLEGRVAPLLLPGTLIEVDTTDWQRVSLPAVLQKITTSLMPYESDSDHTSRS
jgi:predicted kinase